MNLKIGILTPFLDTIKAISPSLPNHGFLISVISTYFNIIFSPNLVEAITPISVVEITRNKCLIIKVQILESETKNIKHAIRYGEAPCKYIENRAIKIKEKQPPEHTSMKNFICKLI